MAVSTPDFFDDQPAPEGAEMTPAATAIRRKFIRQGRRSDTGLIVTGTAGRWNVSGPVDIDALAAAAVSAARIAR
jgi:hypothetical protein